MEPTGSEQSLPFFYIKNPVGSTALRDYGADSKILLPQNLLQSRPDSIPLRFPLEKLHRLPHQHP